MSAFSEPENAGVTERFLAFRGQRLKDSGLTDDGRAGQHTVDIKQLVVFFVDEVRVRTVLDAADMAPPLQLYQALFAKMLLIQRSH